jgi:kumamolisin
VRDRNTATKKGDEIGTPRRHLRPMAIGMAFPKILLLVVAALLAIGGNARADVGDAANGQHLVTESVKAVDASRIVRTQLTSQELAATQPATIALNLRNRDELAARIVKGDIISPAEMAARYYPTHETWAAVANWATSQSLAVAPEDNTRMSVVTHGRVDQIANALRVQFARVQGDDGKEYTSAISAPSIPSEFTSSVSGILRLQPQFHPHILTVYNPIGTLTFGPQYLLDHYGATGVGDGTGQIIAIWGFNSPPNATDLITYWAKIGSPHTMADVTIINPSNYPAYNDAPGNAAGFGHEVTMDVEIASGLCPGAKIRIYCIDDLTQMVQAVLADAAQYPQMHELSISAGVQGETDTQSFMALAAQGVTTFSGSGDAGSNPDPATNGQSYNASAPLAVSYPASDPYVTGVGGTQEIFGGLGPNNSGPTTTGVQVELAWTGQTNPPYTEITMTTASGGGISTYPRPAWQTGPGVPAGSLRCVPDVAAEAQGDLYIYAGGDTVASGTSESAPIWAALCAILNESLQSTGHNPIGLLGPKIYPLAGTGAMNYVTQGYLTYELAGVAGFPADAVDTNGAYEVGPTYDLITGLGVPNVAQIAAALEAPPAGLAVSVATPLPSSAVVNGSAPITLTASATGSPTAFQWELNGVAIAGATNATEIVYPTAANEGAYSVVVTNSAGSASTTAGTLLVTTDAWIVNLSARAYAETGPNLLIAGFVTTGFANKTLLIRGDGPALSGFGITDFLTDPQLTLFNGTGSSLSTTESWSTSLDATFIQVGAFSLTAGSHDTALLESFAPGAYTAQIVSQTTNNGVALAEIYDADNTAPTNRLINISARAAVGTGANILIGGFVVSGSTPQTVVIRGDGPSLTALGVPGALSNPVLTLFNSSGGVIASNTGWGSAPILGSAGNAVPIQPLTTAISAKVGAFALEDGSADSAIVATLPPGDYTAQVSGANASTGVALVEIYELR